MTFARRLMVGILENSSNNKTENFRRNLIESEYKRGFARLCVIRSNIYYWLEYDLSQPK